MLQISPRWKLPGDPGCCRGGCWEVHRPGTNPGAWTLPESHSQPCGQRESSDRGESGVVTGPRLRPTRKQTSPSLHVPWNPTSTHPVALASLPTQRPPGCITSLTPLWRRPRDSGPGWARLRGPRAWVHSWVWPWEPQRSYLAQAGGAVGFLCKNQSAFPLVVWLPLRCETLPSSVIVPSSSNVAQSASSKA